MSVGDDLDPDRLFPDSYLDLSTAGSYVVSPNFVYNNATDASNTVKVFILAGTSSAGAATIIVNYQ